MSQGRGDLRCAAPSDYTGGQADKGVLVVLGYSLEMPAMDRIGLSFKSSLSPDEVREQYVQPLAAALEEVRAGIYINYLRQLEEGVDVPEHLLMFQVRDFQHGLRLLRMTLEEIGPPGDVAFHNLNPSDPMY